MNPKNEEAAPVVFVVDDDASVRLAIQNLLDSVGLQAVTYASAREFLSTRRLDAPSCLVLDVRLPEQSGLDFQIALAESDIRIPIIFITGHGDIAMAVGAMKAGAIEFLTKPFREQDLLDAIQRGIDRDRALRRQQTEIEGLRQRLSSLTPRERQVLALTVGGLSNKQIASELGTGESVVKFHRGQVMRKMQVTSLPDLVRITDRLGHQRHLLQSSKRFDN